LWSEGIAPSNDIEEVEEEIHDCIRIAHPGFPRASLPEFIDSVDEVVGNLAEQEEQYKKLHGGPKQFLITRHHCTMSLLSVLNLLELSLSI